MTYSILPVALLAGDALQGALVMLAFGLGTLPNLLAVGWVAGRARRHLDRPAIRWGAAAVLVVFAALGIWHAMGDPGRLADGPFCLLH
jgi:sulfite exporter TauE/SafE